MRVAFLGLGAIGAPMAAHLARRWQLTVYNRTPQVAADFAARHSAEVAATPRDAVGQAEVVVTCLPTSREVEAMLDGPAGLLAGLRRGALLLDCTSGDPAGSRGIAGRLARQDVAFADAPVSGGTNGAEAGTLTVMAVGEGLAALVKAGVGARTAVEVLNASSGRSFVSESLVPERVLTGQWPRTFRLALLEKDVAIARSLLEDVEVPGPMLQLAGKLFAQAGAELGDQADYV